MATEDTEGTTANEVTLDLWRKSPYLTVDEFMCLLLGYEPGTYRFDYETTSNMPSDAVPIYRMLTKDICEFKLDIYFYGIKVTSKSELLSIDEKLQSGGMIASTYNRGGYWWNNGKILTEDLKKWVKDKGIESKFLETTADSETIKQTRESDAETQLNDKEEKQVQTDKKNEPLMISFEEIIDVDPRKITPKLVANNYLLMGILLEFIVGDFEDITFKNQSELVDHIVKVYYEQDGIKGISKRNVDKKFSIANNLKTMLNAAKKQLEEELKNPLP